MTNTQQLHPVKRVITFIMALLMMLNILNTFALSVDAAQVNIQLWVYIGDSGVNANFSAHWNTFGGGIYKANGFNSLDTGASLRDVLKTRNAACITDLESNLTRTGYDLVGFDISKFGVATVSTVPSFVNNTAAWWPVAYISYDDFVAGNTNSLVYGSTADNWAFQLLPDWKPKTYTLTLDAGEGTIDGDKTKTYSIKYNQSYKDAFGGTFPTPVREGYEFQYYDYNNGQFGLHTGSWENNYYNITWSDTMTAVWKCKHENTTVINSVAATCTQAGSETVKCGTCNETFTTTIAKLEHNRQWVSSDGVNRYDLYRCKYVNCNYSFTHKRITVTYNANGGALIVDGKKINDPTKNAYHELETTDENAVVPVTPPYEAEMPGAEFLGWSTDPYATKADTTFSSDINYTLHAVYGKETYTITFDAGQDDTLDPPRKGTLPEGLNEVVNIQYGVLLKEAISATIPEPKLPGYTFGGWQEYNNGKEGTLYTAENWETARYTPNPVGSTIFKAVFVPNEKHTLTLNLHDGTLPSGYQASYTFLEGQYFNDVIGGFPVPTKTGNAFKGWQWNNRTDHHWTDGWGVNQTYYFTGDIELDAIWKSTPYVFEFDLNADGDATAAQQTGFATKYGIDVGDPISTTVGGFPIPTRDKYNFVGWEMPVYDSEGNSVTKIFTRDKGWESTVYNYKGNTTAKAIWEIACRHKNDDGSYYELSWDTESDPLRHKGICENCETLAAYGYVVKFWSRGDFNGDGSENTRACLSQGLPMEDIFNIKTDENGAPYTENVIYDPQTCRITDYIDDGKNPKITIDFNPCLVASKNTYEVWTGWTYTDYYDTDNDGGVDKTKVMPATHGNKQGFMYIFDDKWQGGSNPLRNTHIDFYIVYAEGYNEVLFDAGYAFIPDYPDNTKTRKMEITSGGVIVDSNRRFAVMAIKDDQTYKDALNYIPTAKYVAGDVLYCSVGWKHEGHDHLIDCESWNEDLTYESKEHVGDSVIYAYYCYYDSDNNKNNLSNGYLTTYYANNKYAHMGNVNGVVGAYNNAYFDPETNIGGTMHYIYYIPTVNGVYEEYNAATHGANDYIVYNGKKYPVKCEPLFAYDPDEDYLNAYKFPGAPGDDVKNVDEYYHAIYKCDFNIRSYAEYLFEKGTVIAKEPKRYTVYVGEGMHFTFPTVVCDPEGVFVDEPVYKPENSNKITVNGNTFYTSLGNSNFTLSRNDKGWATMFIYTEATTPVTYGTGLNLGLLPYTNYESTTEVSSMHNYNTCFPYGSHGVYFHAPYTQVVVGKDENDNEITEKYKAFTDFNTNSYNSEYTVYGSGLKLTYPDKSVYKVDGFNGEQYAYYQQWEYALKFNANCDKELLTNEGYDESNVVYNTIRPLNVGADDPIHIYGNDLYTRDDYIVAYWCTKPNGVGTKYTDGMTVNNNVGVIFDVDTMFTSSCDAMMSFCEAGITLYAYWVRTVDFTLHKSGTSPTANFAKVTYYHPVADKQMDEVEVSQTQVFKCKPGTVVTVEIIDAPAASQYEFSYFTWNIPYRDTVGDSGINLNKKPDRILTNRMTYSFTILSHSAMTARFVSRGSTTPFYIDRNNKLLRAPENNVPDSWLLYSDTSTPRAWYGVTSAPTSSDPSASNQPLSGENYYTYKSNTRYSIKVSGSTYSAMNTTHTKLYDDVLTLMTDAVNGTNRFVGWQLGNKYISYEPIYKYRVTGNAEITAVYSSTSVTDTGYVTLTSDGTDAYILTRHAPEGYTLLESGFLLTTDSTETDFEELLYQKSVYRITTTDTNKDGSFRLKLKEKSYYGYGYAIYKYMDGGVEKTVEYTVPLTQ